MLRGVRVERSIIEREADRKLKGKGMTVRYLRWFGLGGLRRNEMIGQAANQDLSFWSSKVRSRDNTQQ